MKYLWGVLMLIVIGALAFAYTAMPPSETTSDIPSDASNTRSPESPIVTVAYTDLVSEDSREYRSNLFGFSIIYPKELQVLEYDDGTSATTITFEEGGSERGFQIFIVPYTADHITQEQFKKDVPSGVMKEPVDILLDGVPATMFFSTLNSVEMREVWFIRDGLLFEITAPKAMDEWLSEIMKNWKFI